MSPSHTARLLAQEIVNLCDPEEIWLYNKKTDLGGKTTGFKLCVVTSDADTASLEQKIYLALDCPIPYDLTVYTKTEWKEALENPFSFAGSISEKGYRLYGKTP
ncbi:MAG: hypothetical protein HFE45_05785 [Oscillospiraceae bacterium]|jgi:hypothetical protein|nr:hypothetical protein [Oscillospiraceae bacterium]